MTRYDLGIMYYFSKISLRILPWDPWSPRCSKHLVRSCQDIQDASKRVNPGCYITNFELIIVVFAPGPNRKNDVEHNNAQAESGHCGVSEQVRGVGPHGEVWYVWCHQKFGREISQVSTFTNGLIQCTVRRYLKQLIEFR